MNQHFDLETSVDSFKVFLNERSSELVYFKSEIFIENVSGFILSNLYGYEKDFYKDVSKNVIEQKTIET